MPTTGNSLVPGENQSLCVLLQQKSAGFKKKISTDICSLKGVQDSAQLAAAPQLEETGELFRAAVGARTQHTLGFLGFFCIFLDKKRNNSSLI